MNIFVAKLDYATQEDSLYALFEQFGPVKSAKIIFDHDTQRSKGFGFVEMENHQDGQKAIDELDGVNFEGRNIVLKEARPRNERSNNGYNNRY